MPLKSKEAQKAYEKAWRRKNKARRAARGRAWRRKNPVKAGWTLIRSRSKKKGLEVSLTFERYQALTSEPCHYCQDYFREPDEHGGFLDRIDNTKGYALDNVMPCCGFCNYIRGDMLTVEETKVAIEAIIDYRIRETLKAKFPPGTVGNRASA